MLSHRGKRKLVKNGATCDYINAILLIPDFTIPDSALAIRYYQFKVVLDNELWQKPNSILVYEIALFDWFIYGEIMSDIKDRVLREFGDQGAETLQRYFVQIRYSVLWCVRMLLSSEGIEAVIPEGVEDLVIIRRGYHELHQVKTRSESQGPWTIAEVLPIICKQYHRRKAFEPIDCHYHFVSNCLADNKIGKQNRSTLYQLKHLLEIINDGQSLTSEETASLAALEKNLVPKIQQELSEKHDETATDESVAKACFYATRIETDSLDLKIENLQDEIQAAFLETNPDNPTFTTYQLEHIFERILLLVIGKILSTKSIDDRKITREDVLKCRVAPQIIGNIDLDQIPGESIIDKKAYLGGFDITEIPIFNRQRKQADWIWRNLESLGMGPDLERLTTSLLDLQSTCRNAICRLQGIEDKPGPKILDMLRPDLSSAFAKIIPGQPDVDEQFCLGILWNQTDLCLAWWHGYEDYGLGSHEIEN